MKTTTTDGALQIMAALEARIDQEAGDQARKEAAGLNRTILDELDKLGLMTMNPHAFVSKAFEERKKRLVDQLTHQAISNLMPVASATGATPARSLVEMKIVVDAHEAVDKIKAVLRDEYGAPRHLEQGETLTAEPDPRMDEIIVLLKRLVRHVDMSARSGSDGIECHVGTMAPHGGLKPGKA